VPRTLLADWNSARVLREQGTEQGTRERQTSGRKTFVTPCYSRRRLVPARRQTPAITLGIVCFPLVFGATPRALAQANYDGVNLGGRTAMMGGAGVARGSDGATAFINPAGLARIPGESFSFSTFALELSGRTVNGQLDPGGTLGLPTADSTSLSVGLLPQTFCLFLDGPPRDHTSVRSRHKYGMCAQDTEGDSFLFTSNPRNPTDTAGVSQTTRLRWAKSTAALTWAYQLLPQTAIGVTARADASRLEDHSSTTSFSNMGQSGVMQTLDQTRTSVSWDIGVTVGVTHQVSRVVTLGASLSSPSQHIYGFHDGTEAFSTTDGNVATLVQDVGGFRYSPPANLRLGLGFAWPSFNFELNGSYYGASDQLAVANFDRFETGVVDGVVVGGGPTVKREIVERAQPVVNFLFGAEAFLSPDFSIMVGAQTDFSGLPARQPGDPADVLFRQARDVFHASLGVASYSPSGSLILGVRGFYATGTVLSAGAPGPTPTFVVFPQSEWSVSLVVSGQISFEAVRDVAIRAATPLLTKDAAEAVQ